MKHGPWICLIVLLASGACSPRRYLNKEIDQAEKDFHDHIGFTLYDPQQGKVLYDHQGDRYFIPASNTKIFTLYASLQLLGDSIPAFRYAVHGDSLIVWGTGDPSFLYDEVVLSDRTLHFLSTQRGKLFFSSTNHINDHFGPGWSWEDYRYAYQVERTPFPIYGNRFHMRKVNASFVPTPTIFKTEISRASTPQENHDMVRDFDSNALIYIPGLKDTVSEWEIPFRYSDELFLRLLSDTLKREVHLTAARPSPDAKLFYAVPSDSLYKVMMQESDNFIAEQLLVMCAGVLSDTLKSEIAIREVKKRYLSDLQDPPVWMDGSGLSRMNLFTPRSIVQMWSKINDKVPRERLVGLLAVGGVNGTIRNYFKGPGPYVFGKTGTLRNNYNLSGFLVTQKGRTLIFSWMNNNFTTTTGTVRSRMEAVLKNIYEKY